MSSIRSQAGHLHLPIHLLATMDIPEMFPVTPTSSTEASTLIAGRIASRAKTLLNNTIGDQTQVPLRFSSHPTLETMHPLHLHPSTPLLVRALVAGKTVRDQSSAVRTVLTPHSHRGLLQRTLRRGRVIAPPDLHLRPTSGPTIDTLLPHPRRRPSPPDQTEHPRLRMLPRTTPSPQCPRPRPHDPPNPRHCLKGTTPWRRSACRGTTVILVKVTTLPLVALVVVSKVASGVLCPSTPSRRRRRKRHLRGRPPRLMPKHLSSPRQPGRFATPRIPPRQPSRRSLGSHCSTQS